MSITDYLLMRTPVTRMTGPSSRLGGELPPVPPGKISAPRIVLSLFGVILGIVASFYVTGLRPEDSSQAEVGGQRLAVSTSGPAASPTITPRVSEPRVAEDLSLGRLLRVGLIALVACLLTYQGLYFSLKLYQNEPALLILFISFQYGYFWQSLVKGAQALT